MTDYDAKILKKLSIKYLIIVGWLKKLLMTKKYKTLMIDKIQIR